ncbi:hypothetical protein CPAST_c40270 [Clostridium pasteurianum DSM 525 = ATCC 6013]|uniref:Phage XkdN-like protein n=1 Tax=Clostridium pasteurianum DSM 525 = ATCC 6013 TaxID=1262449 RepID=A0A0H3J825_CLOPA|nr:hypothetical protein [Clostridium pasteurianum]AJA50056.1 hypothetical protein CPAST_c40270 [Clostridium pasteurianum DSM 525 = ATCC 6013]AJA54044.1 hypothetical protein CLPA_c40270 [Clostridium pasteurianum DSM 525 = ATCC 6013]AOZ77182.1 hypothetical protein AQ983_19580 [Clostridium pasteurianum DSM 525 = ATCC 6013]AOZ80979.1 hypothetical protein AQ984_19575 [Clostridium pasteurianum]ELP59239.1 hypothetical protein F502_10173 [Clostridium pasteurianum DSM 525 = ATCC 6013]
MGRLYDIAGRLDNSKPEVKIDEEHIFKINTSKAVGLKIDDIHKDDKLGDFEKIDTVIKVALGPEAFDYIESLDLTIPNYTTIINTIMAALGDTSLEEVEEAAKDQNKKK